MSSTLPRCPLRFVHAALDVARSNLASYSAPTSPRKYTQHQLFAILALKEFLQTDFRGIIELLEQSPEIRTALDLKQAPHYSTLCYAEKRLRQKEAFAGVDQTATVSARSAA